MIFVPLFHYCLHRFLLKKLKKTMHMHGDSIFRRLDKGSLREITQKDRFFEYT